MRRFNSIRNPLRSPRQNTQSTANQPRSYSPSPPLEGRRQRQQGNTDMHRTPWQRPAPRDARHMPREADDHEADDFDSGSNSSRSPSPPRQRGAQRQNTRGYGDGSARARPQVSRRNTQVSRADSMSSRSPSPRRGNQGARRDGYPRNDDNDGGDDDDDDDEAEMLRRAMAESLNFRDRERHVQESRRQIQETVEAAYRESEAAAARQRVQDAQREEEQREIERQALEESRRTEEERVQRRRDQLTRMDRQFGSGSGPAARAGAEFQEHGGRSRRRATDFNADAPASSATRGNSGPSPEESGRGHRQQRRRESATTHRDQQPPPAGRASAARDYPQQEQQRQRQHQLDPSQAVGWAPRRGPSTAPAFASGPPTMEQPGPPPSLSQPHYTSEVVPPQQLPFAGMAVPRPGSPGPGHARARSPAHTTNPADYSIEDVLALSMRDSHRTAPRSEDSDDSDDSNHEELQAAINASAEQHRDEEQEAIQRNMGIPSYQEACAAPRVRAPRGARYKFQGPNKAVLGGDEDGEGSGGAGGDGSGKKPATELEIVGDMDLNEAMRIANAGSKRTGGKNKQPARR